MHINNWQWTQHMHVKVAMDDILLCIGLCSSWGTHIGHGLFESHGSGLTWICRYNLSDLEEKSPW